MKTNNWNTFLKFWWLKWSVVTLGMPRAKLRKILKKFNTITFVGVNLNNVICWGELIQFTQSASLRHCVQVLRGGKLDQVVPRSTSRLN